MASGIENFISPYRASLTILRIKSCGTILKMESIMLKADTDWQ